jgi:hypothetical protein
LIKVKVPPYCNSPEVAAAVLSPCGPEKARVVASKKTNTVNRKIFFIISPTGKNSEGLIRDIFAE